MRVLVLESCDHKTAIFAREFPEATICRNLEEAIKAATENDYDLIFVGCWLDGLRDSAQEFLKTRFHGNSEAFVRKFNLDEVAVIVHAEFGYSGRILASLSNGQCIPFRQINWQGLKKCLRLRL